MLNGCIGTMMGEEQGASMSSGNRKKECLFVEEKILREKEHKADGLV